MGTYLLTLKILIWNKSGLMCLSNISTCWRYNQSWLISSKISPILYFEWFEVVMNSLMILSKPIEMLFSCFNLLYISSCTFFMVIFCELLYPNMISKLAHHSSFSVIVVRQLSVYLLENWFISPPFQEEPCKIWLI